jgi:hypothetical protein
MPKPALKRKQIQAALIVGVSTVVAAVIATRNSSQPNLPTAPSTIASSSNDQRPSAIPGEVNPHTPAKTTVPKTQSPSERLKQGGRMPSEQISQNREINELQSTEPSSAPKDKFKFDDQSVVPSMVGVYKISEGSPLQLQQGNLTLAIQFSETMGVEYATLIASTRERTIRDPIINPGTQILLPVEPDLLRLSVLEIQWSERTVSVELGRTDPIR